MKRLVAMFALSAVLSGCTVYHALPLASGPEYSALLLPTAGALDMAEVAALAVQRSPDLVTSRRRADVAAAQSFAAGLLPDPQLSLSTDHPTAPNFVNAYMLGLSEDLQALLTHPARATAAQAAADQAKLAAIWDEWQTIEKACTLYVQKTTADEKQTMLSLVEAVLATQAGRSSRALAMHDATLDQAGVDLAAALDTASQRNLARRDALVADINLKALIDVHPTGTLELAGLGQPETFTEEQLNAALTNIAGVRPDLLALQAGYRSQEEAVWIAVLSQFPTITLGFTREADTSNVHTIGLTATVNLPIFNGARGEIRVQSATRAQLHAEYQARLDQTTADAWRLWQEINLLRNQIAELTAALPTFRKMAENSRRAYAATFMLMQSSLLARESELLDLRSSLWIDSIVLHTILGQPYVPAASRLEK